MIKTIKQKKCAVCKEKFTPMSSLSRVCGMPCALDFAEKKTAKDKKKSNVEQKKKFLANDAPFQKAKAQKTFNEFIRLRDAELGCISCDKPKDWHGQWHASHWKSRGARPDLAFNEDNVHKACSVCNNWLSGNVGEFRKSLILKIGIERVGALEVDSGSKKYSAQDYSEISKIYTAKIKEIKLK